MQDGLYVALSSQMALEKRLNTIADNVANTSTVGFRATGVKFEDVVSGLGQTSRSPSSPRATPTFRTRNGRAARDRQPLRFRHPGRRLVRHRDAGRHRHDPRRPLHHHRERRAGDDRRLSRARRRRRADPARPAGTARRRPAPTASLRQRRRRWSARSACYTFDPGPNFIRFGNSGIVPAGEPEPVIDRLDAGVAQGFLEESNVNPVLEITRLIMVQRAFENGAAMIRDTECLLRRGDQDPRFEIALDDRSHGRPRVSLQPDAGQPARSAGARMAARFPTSTRWCCRGGRISEVSPTHYRVRGLSDVARLGDIVEHRSRAGLRQRRDRADLPRRGTDRAVRARCAMPASATLVFDLGPFSVLPHATWRGRVHRRARPRRSTAARLWRKAIRATQRVSRAPPALARQRVGKAFAPASRVIDIFTPICFGQRLGIFAGSGVGKSTLLAMLAAAYAFDTVVVALVGERGREVREFLEDTIGPNAAWPRPSPSSSTSDESAMMRQPRARHRHARRRAFPRPRATACCWCWIPITRFAHALARSRDRHGRAAGRARLSRLRLHRPAEAAGARRPRHRRHRLHHRHHLRADRRRRPQRPGRRFACAASSTVTSCSTARSPSRAATRRSTRFPRSRASHRKPGATTSARWSTRLKAMISRFEIDARHPPARRLPARRRRRARRRRPAGAADLRGDDADRRATARPPTPSPISPAT